ncbi:hypothetical protein A8L34_20065 [Bacillus sp. FJAT-27264]|uniref:DUF2933 domain-containing protein n=1 Tax=Paenibacillus sp. (strain DSM 101736 / FJAT-27264) TaxID=1850362 RepID=UPI000807EC88|nr:DUF2933 domain-containing protein [Bacillus sp. FJAT-27264]OBZ09582.1 hypothetical protein A8L34_20065 [Bacillus sp. FJAT-27264]
MDWSWLLLLACPLMMIFMMFGMRGGHGHGHGHGSSKQPAAQEFQAELQELRIQNERMQKEIQELKQS